MFQVEERFELNVLDFGSEVPPIRHYAIAEVVQDHPCWLLTGRTKVREPGKAPYDRDTFWMTTRAMTTAGLLLENDWIEPLVTVFLPPSLKGAGGQYAPKTCTAIWRFQPTPNSLDVWGFDTPDGRYIDPFYANEAGFEVPSKVVLVWQASMQ